MLHAMRSWSRHCVKIRKVAASILHGVTGNFPWLYLPGRNMALGSTQSLTRNEYQEYYVGGTGCRCVGLTTLPPSCADCLEIWNPQSPGILTASPSLFRDCFAFTCGLLTDRHLIRERITKGVYVYSWPSLFCWYIFRLLNNTEWPPTA
jgi:hypothetical protein